MSESHNLSAFIRALAHRLRTPLSVISNDLFYFSSLVPAGECDRSQQKCREISALLERCAALSNKEGAVESIALGRFLPEAKEGGPVVVTTTARARVVVETLVMLFSGLTSELTVACSPGTLQLKGPLKVNSENGLFASLTDCMHSRFIRDCPFSPLLDLFFFEHQQKVTITLESSIITLTV